MPRPPGNPPNRPESAATAESSSASESSAASLTAAEHRPFAAPKTHPLPHLHHAFAECGVIPVSGGEAGGGGSGNYQKIRVVLSHRARRTHRPGQWAPGSRSRFPVRPIRFPRRLGEVPTGRVTSTRRSRPIWLTGGPWGACAGWTTAQGDWSKGSPFRLRARHPHGQTSRSRASPPRAGKCRKEDSGRKRCRRFRPAFQAEGLAALDESRTVAAGMGEFLASTTFPWMVPSCWDHEGGASSKTVRRRLVCDIDRFRVTCARPE